LVVTGLTEVGTDMEPFVTLNVPERGDVKVITSPATRELVLNGLTEVGTEVEPFVTVNVPESAMVTEVDVTLL
jgi:hypothetical protein